MQDTRIIHIGADHAGFDLKEELMPFLQSLGYEVVDHGAYEYEEDDDYPDFIIPVAQAVSSDMERLSKGIVIGGSGQGEAIAANKFPNVRAVVWYGSSSQNSDGASSDNIIVLSREHNDANILSIGARFVSVEEAKEAVELWLETAFSGDERHVRRINKIES
jgi:ribose 5-phosphate isomerase B